MITVPRIFLFRIYEHNSIWCVPRLPSDAHLGHRVIIFLRPLPIENGIRGMADFRELARDPKHRRRFEKLLYLAALRGDADLVAE
jgi:hypothetical protein